MELIGHVYEECKFDVVQEIYTPSRPSPSLLPLRPGVPPCTKLLESCRRVLLSKPLKIQRISFLFLSHFICKIHPLPQNSPADSSREKLESRHVSVYSGSRRCRMASSSVLQGPRQGRHRHIIISNVTE